MTEHRPATRYDPRPLDPGMSYEEARWQWDRINATPRMVVRRRESLGMNVLAALVTGFVLGFVVALLIASSRTEERAVQSGATAPHVSGGIQSDFGEVRESAVGWHRYPDQVPGGAVLSATLGGTATWYCGHGSACTRGYSGNDLVAAIDPSTGIDKGDLVTVSHDGRAVLVRIVDVCACSGRRVIDLTSGAFSRLAPLSAGVIPVTLTTGASLPQTDTLP